MKNFILITLFSFISFNVFSNQAEIEFIGICDEQPMLKTVKSFEDGDNLGELSIKVLDLYEVDYQGNERGINTAFQTPFGDESLVVLSDTEMKAYGWCFSISGQVPEVYADQIILENGDKISWYYAFAHYKNGEWIAQCSPSWKNPLKRWCSK